MKGTLDNTEPAKVNEGDVEKMLPDQTPTTEQVMRSLEYLKRVDELTKHPKIIEAALVMNTSPDATARAVATLAINVDDEATTPDLISQLLQKAVEAMRHGESEALEDEAAIEQRKLAEALEPNKNPLFKPEEILILKGCRFRVVKTQGALMLVQYVGLTSAQEKRIKKANLRTARLKPRHR